MIIKQYKGGALTKEISFQPSMIGEWADSVNKGFNDALKGKYCSQASQVDDSGYEFHITGAHKLSTPVKGTLLSPTYKWAFDFDTMESWVEIYYNGTAFTVPKEITPQIVGQYRPRILSSIKYTADEQEVVRSYYMIRSHPDEPEFDRVATQMGITGDVSHAWSIKVDMHTDSEFFAPCVYVKEV